MEALNYLNDIENYKKFGNFTKPFLPDEFIYKKVMLDIKNKHKDENSVYFLLSLCLWIHNNVNYSKEKDLQNLKNTQLTIK